LPGGTGFPPGDFGVPPKSFFPVIFEFFVISPAIHAAAKSLSSETKICACGDAFIAVVGVRLFQRRLVLWLGGGGLVAP
jgi:hypothetical protein